MDTVAPLQPALEMQAQTAKPAPVAPPPPQAQADREPTQPSPSVAAPQSRLHVELDREAGRFVQTLTDLTTDQIVRRYPSEAQLAYSRAVMAYMRALAES
ncbi:MAG: hypothetical protein K2P58_04605 [Hyphomonadaceae bacterium]|nr:hypothetical protein [Hyphomonadaceae bacterium]